MVELDLGHIAVRAENIGFTWRTVVWDTHQNVLVYDLLDQISEVAG